MLLFCFLLSFKSLPQFLFLCPELGLFLIPTYLFQEFSANFGNFVVGQGLWNCSISMRATLCRQLSLGSVCVGKNCLPLLMLNMNYLNAACNLLHSHILTSMIQCKRQWSTLSQGARVSTFFLNQIFFRNFENCFLKPGVEYRGLESEGRSLMSIWRFVTLIRCFSFLSVFSLLWSSLLLYLYSWVHSVVCWRDWQGENHSSLLISQVLLGKQGSSNLVF